MEIWSFEVRITGGDLGGRQIAAPKNLATRPTSDGTRETLFNILQNSFGLEFSVVLDLFSGSGAVAFDAISRGASYAILVESDKSALACIKRNAEALQLSQNINVINQPAIEKWPSLIKKTLNSKKIDFVFSDPPYRKGLSRKSLEVLTRKAPEIFAVGCVWALEIEKTEDSPETPSGWELIKERVSGAAKLLFYRRLSDGEVG